MPSVRMSICSVEVSFFLIALDISSPRGRVYVFCSLFSERGVRRDKPPTPKAIVEIPRSQFPAGMKMEPGMTMQAGTQNAELRSSGSVKSKATVLR